MSKNIKNFYNIILMRKVRVSSIKNFQENLVIVENQQ